MNPEIFAEWKRRQGYQVLQTASSYWFNQGPRVFQAFPYHWVIEPTEKDVRVRYRIDGTLHEALRLPKKNQNAIVARIKIMSKLVQ